jgi:L-fucose isomerase-like protein
MALQKKVALFWPGDYRPEPNKWALPYSQRVTEQMTRALKKLGRAPYLVKGYLTRPCEAIEKLGPIDDPMIGLFVHWTYAPHVCDGVSGKTNPLLLASNFSGACPGLVALMNTSASLEMLGRAHARIWTDAEDWTRDKAFMARLEDWLATGQIAYDASELHADAAIDPKALAAGRKAADQIRARRVLAMMLGDTSMGMINGYFGIERLHKIGFTEHKVDQAWLISRVKGIKQKRVDDALAFCLAKGLKFHWRENAFGVDASDFDKEASKQQLRMYLAILDLLAEFKCDCMGFQYQLGLFELLPPSDLAEGLLNSTCRPEGDGDPIVCSTEADQGNMIPMELMKRLLKAKGLNPSTNFHDVRWGGMVGKRFLWEMLNSGSCSAYAFNHDGNSLTGVHSYRQPKGYFPVPGGTFCGESLAGPITWARAYVSGGRLCMDVGEGEAVKVSPKDRDRFWLSTNPQWPLMMVDLHCSVETIMAHYQSNHMAICYGDIFGEMIALSRELGFQVRVISGRQ